MTISVVEAVEPKDISNVVGMKADISVNGDDVRGLVTNFVPKGEARAEFAVAYRRAIGNKVYLAYVCLHSSNVKEMMVDRETQEVIFDMFSVPGITNYKGAMKSQVDEALKQYGL